MSCQFVDFCLLFLKFSLIKLSFLDCLVLLKLLLKWFFVFFLRTFLLLLDLVEWMFVKCYFALQIVDLLLQIQLLVVCFYKQSLPLTQLPLKFNFLPCLLISHELTLFLQCFDFLLRVLLVFVQEFGFPLPLVSLLLVVVNLSFGLLFNFILGHFFIAFLFRKLDSSNFQRVNLVADLLKTRRGLWWFLYSIISVLNSILVWFSRRIPQINRRY